MLSKIEILINKRYLEVCQSLIVEYRLKSKAALARTINIHPQILSDYKKNKLKVGIGALSKTIQRFPEINLSYILTGEGEIFQDRYEIDDRNSLWKEDPAKFLKSIKENDFEKIKIELLIMRSRCAAYEIAFTLMGKNFWNDDEFKEPL